MKKAILNFFLHKATIVTLAGLGVFLPGTAALTDHTASKINSERAKVLETENSAIKRDVLARPKIDTNKIKSIAFQKGVESVDTNQPFIHGIIYGKFLCRDSVQRLKSMRRYSNDWFNIAIDENNNFTLTGTNKSAFKETGKLRSHIIKAEHK